MALFGAVHPGLRAVVYSLTLGVSIWALVVAPRERLGPRILLSLVVPATVLTLLCGLPLLPVGPELRQTLQPGIASAVGALLAQAGADQAPLALYGRRAAVAWGSLACVTLFAVATAVTARSRRRRVRLAVGLVITALVVVCIQLVQSGLGWSEIYAVSGIPAATRYPFFGPFVSHNHAAALLACAVPLAAGLALRPHREWRLLGGVAFGALLLGLVWAQSRGGVLSAVVALGVFASVAWGRRAAVPLGVLGGASAGAVLVVGVERATVLLTRSFMPGALDDDAFGNRGAVWSEAWTLLAGAPLAGVGPGGFRDGYKLVKASPEFFLVDHAHSEPLQALVEHGVLLGALWVALPLTVVALGVGRALRLPQGRRRSLLAGWLGCAASLLVTCVFDFPLRIGALALPLASALGVLAASAASDRPGGSPRGRLVAQACGAALVAVGLVAVVLPAADAVGSSAPPLADHWAQAVSLDASGQDPDAALQALEAQAASRVAARPLDHVAAVWLVRARLGQGHLTGARDAAEALSQAYPSLPTAWLLLAEIDRQRGELEASRLAWRRGLALDLANAQRDAEVVQTALRVEADPASVAEQILPDRADRLRDGGVFLARRGDREVAERLLARAAALDPDVGLAYVHWLLEWGEPDAAREALSRARGDGCRVQLLRGRVGVELADWEPAGQAFRRARASCESELDLEVADLGAARTLLALNDRDAFEEVEAVLRRYPNRHGLRRALIDALIRSGRYEETIPHYDMLVLTGVANLAELAAMERVGRGLPPL